MTENVLLTQKNFLLCVNEHIIKPEYISELNYIKDNFCGRVVSSIDECELDVLIYICGDLSQITTNKHLNVIEELSINFDSIENYSVIKLGQVPINIYNTGVYFRQFFHLILIILIILIQNMNFKI